MSDSFVGEIRLFAGNFAPLGWAFCHGQVLPIAENDVLFTLIGTTYGGDGQTTFNLPDLRGRVPVHMGQGAGLNAYAIGQQGGAEQVTLGMSETPAHTHPLVASTAAGTSANAQGNVLGDSPVKLYFEAAANNALNPAAVGNAGGSQPHENRMPYVAVNYIISLFGIFPSQG